MYEFHIITTSSHVDELTDQLTLLGAAAVTWQDAGDQPIYEPKPAEIIHWEAVKIIALFETDELLPQIEDYLHRLQEQRYLSQFELQEVQQQDWVRLTRESFVPTKMGKRLWVCPSWCEPIDANAINVMLDPGLAFGTGSHATTSLCLEWLDEHIHGGETVIDYGCGSGILAIAALKLGAAHAIAVDYDQQALDATRMNADLNHLSDTQIVICLPEAIVTHPVDVIVANILAKPIIELAKHFSTLLKPNGKIALSGILESQCDEVMQVYQQFFVIDPVVIKDGWACISGRRNR